MKRSLIACLLMGAATVFSPAIIPAAALAANSLTAPAPVAGKPNIIFILLDDLPIDDIGVDNPRLHTPNIDRLVHEGMYIPRAAVTSSLCSPSRATILTGLTTRNHHIVDNTVASEAGLTFFPTYLQQAGYQTAFVGKWHMGKDDDAPRPGFNHWISFKGQGTYLPKGDFGQNQIQTLNIDGKVVDRKDYITDELTDYAMDWLKNRRDPAKPFFLYLSHKAVHGPCTPNARHAGEYKGDTYTLPASFAKTPQNDAGKPMWVINQRNSWHGIDIRHGTGPRSMLDERKRCDEALSSVDDSVGRVLDYVTRSGLAKNTVIVFFSDNGSMWGAHGLVDKRNAYEESVRVPMIAWAPGRIPAGVRSEARIRNLDLAPTFLDMAGLQAPAQFEGHSVLPLLTGKASWKSWAQDDFIYEYYWDWEYPMTPATLSIVRNNIKYIQYYGVWDREELYDLNHDPHEMHNLIEDPAQEAARIDLRHRLFAELTSARGDHMIPFTERTDRGFPFRNANGTPPASFPEEWNLVPPPGKDFDFFTLYKKSIEK